MKPSVRISILLVNYNSGKHLFNTVNSIFSSEIKTNYEIVIVDNNSTDNSIEPVIKSFSDIIIVRNRVNSGFSVANNIGVDHCRGEYILFLNSDTLLKKGSVDILLENMEKHKNIGIIAPILLYEDGTFQLSFGRDLKLLEEIFLKFFSKFYYRFYFRFKKGVIEKDVDWVSGACFLIKKSLYKKVGGFDENFFLYMEDADLCKRVRLRGYRVHITSETSIKHLLGKSTGKIFKKILPEIKKSHLYYYKKHNGKLRTSALKLYLLTKFTIKKIFTFKDKGNIKRQVISDVLDTIKRF